MADLVDFEVSVSNDLHGILLNGFPANYWFLNGYYARLPLRHRSSYVFQNASTCYLFELEDGRAGICGQDALLSVLHGRDCYFVRSAHHGDLSKWSTYRPSSIGSTVPEHVAGEAGAIVSLTTFAAKPTQVADTQEQVVGPAVVPSSCASKTCLRDCGRSERNGLPSTMSGRTHQVVIQPYCVRILLLHKSSLTRRSGLPCAKF